MCSISKTPFFCKQKVSAHEGTEKVAICYFLHGRSFGQELSTELINFRESAAHEGQMMVRRNLMPDSEAPITETKLRDDTGFSTLQVKKRTVSEHFTIHSSSNLEPGFTKLLPCYTVSKVFNKLKKTIPNFNSHKSFFPLQKVLKGTYLSRMTPC